MTKEETTYCKLPIQSLLEGSYPKPCQLKSGKPKSGLCHGCLIYQQIKEAILAMEAGEPLDKIVHEEVMGLCVHKWGITEIGERRYFVTGKVCEKCGASSLFAYFKYSTDNSSAWQVEEKIKELGLENKYIIAIIDILRTSYSFFDFIHAKPEVRCKAALLAKLEER